ncbi:MAG: RnfABCDGE type electron transport complex subunit G [Clostridia bacterium]|nr:RnfABCDGE type electron transport complex subunit G [Clostridia bacterium]
MKNFKTIIVTTIILTLICAIATGALALTNELTADRIAAASKKAEQTAMNQMIKAEKFEQGTVKLDDSDYVYYVAKSGDETLGHVFTVEGKGYGGVIKVMVGFGTDGKIIAAKVLEANDETPGLGQNVTKESWVKQFKGTVPPLQVKQQINAVTGATISSKAVTECVNFAHELYKKVMEGGKNG